MDDIATGLTDSINVDGTKAFEANQLMGGFKLTGMGTGSAATDSVTLGQVQAGRANWSDGGGTADAITASYTPAVTSVTDGDLFYVRATAANATTTPTFTPNSGTVTARTIVKNGNVALAAGDIAGDGHELHLRYRSSDTKYELLNPKGSRYTVNGLTEETSVATSDMLGGYDTSGTAERKFSVQNVLKTINGLTEDTSPDPAADYVVTYDGSASDVKKAKLQTIGSRVLLATLSTTSGTTVSATGLDGFRELYVEVAGVSFTGAATLTLAISDDNGAAYGTAQNVSVSSGGASGTIHGTIRITNFINAFSYTMAHAVTALAAGSATVTTAALAESGGGGSSSMNAIRFGGGTFDNGTIYVYGIK